jgi:Domain of unknown function (DUF4398)
VMGEMNMKFFDSTSIKRYAALSSCAATLLLAACASVPPENPALIQAREAVAKLEADPLAQQQAGKPLQASRDALQQAEAAAQQKNASLVDYYAYIAKRKADQGEAMTDETRALQRIAQAQEQRQAILISNRERETQAARDQSAAAQALNAQAQAQAQEAETRAAIAKKRLAEMKAQ